jgi:hypothetical protein
MGNSFYPHPGSHRTSIDFVDQQQALVLLGKSDCFSLSLA